MNDAIPDFVLQGRTEAEAMNALQDYGIISDNCVWWREVGNKAVALRWLSEHPNENGGVNQLT